MLDFALMKFSFSIKPYQYNYVDFQFQSKGISSDLIYSYLYLTVLSIVIKFLVIQDSHK